MKEGKLYYLLLLLSSLLFLTCCSKTPGPKGKKIIQGEVRYLDGASGNFLPAPEAKVKIAYGKNSSTHEFDQIILTDSRGRYEIKGLVKGDYFMTGEYTDEYGFRYTCPGYVVTIKNNRKELELNMYLK